jgi:hypothetical protein
VQNTEQIQQSTRYDLAKIDKSQYTKEQWKAIKETRRREKALDKLAKLDQESGRLDEAYSDNPLVKDKNYILCLKHGTKYSADYVNRLYNGVNRHCTLDFEFVCLTDDPRGINENVKILSLPGGIAGWWCKPYMFSKDLPLKGIVLYMDLDVVIAGNIDKLFTYQPNHWCIVRDFTRAMRSNWPKYNSSVLRFKVGELDFVWDDYIKDPIAVQKKFFGDQDYLYDATYRRKGAMLYPDSWILSWKWEVRKDRAFAPNGRKGQRKLKTIEDVTPRIECCVTVFHGDPNPELCEDPWVIDNWK